MKIPVAEHDTVSRVMGRTIPAMLVAWSCVGCGAALDRTAVEPAAATQCGFRAATSCWTLDLGSLHA